MRLRPSSTVYPGLQTPLDPSRPPRAQPLWIGDKQPVFAMYHAPATAETHPVAVLFCAPFGWQDMGSYPARRIWAERLASAGHPVLRFDLPGTGQSAGGPRDPGQVRSWLQAIVETACWLRHAGDSSRVAAIGLGLGALLALHALGDDAPIDDLVLWGMPASGRALIREMRAFARLQTAAGEGEDPALPTGSLQSGGYLLSDETLADLEALRPERASLGRLRRALLLTDDDAAPNTALVAHLRQAEVEMQTEPGQGYAVMLHDPDSPQFSVVPDATIATVGAWLSQTHSATPPPDQPIPTTNDHLEIESDGSLVRENAFTVTSPSGTMFGMLAEPVEPSRSPDGSCLICLPTWAERCIGPNRLWVELARSYAARGLLVVRIDLEAIGDSDGVSEAVSTSARVFDEDRLAQTQRVMDALGDAGYASRFLLTGLCSGGYWAEQATIDPRVIGALALNPTPSPMGKELLERDVARRVLLVFKSSWWRGVARGEASVRESLVAGKAIMRRTLVRMRQSRERIAAAISHAKADTAERANPATCNKMTTMTALFDQLSERGITIMLGFSSGEPSYRVLELEGITQHPERWPALRLHRFESLDHGLRGIGDQQEIRALADMFVEGALQ
jgi:dienelactone hydrolase